MRYTLLLTVLTAGCIGGESFRIVDRSCDVAFTSWTGGITYHMLQGTGDGSFDYDPAGNVERRLHGSYDLHTGDFSWDVEYAPAHYRTGTSVDGYGYAKLNGDLDALYTVIDTDVLGDTSKIMFDLDRVGCDVDRVDRYLDGDDQPRYDKVHTGRYSRGLYEFEESVEVGDYLSEITGETTNEHAWTRAVTQSTSDYDYTADEYGDFQEGTSRSDWVQDDHEQGVVFAGYDERWMDGRRHRHYSFESDGDTITWDYTVDYHGNGSGTYTQTGLECEVEFEAWDCTLYCGGGQTYDCG